MPGGDHPVWTPVSAHRWRVEESPIATDQEHLPNRMLRRSREPSFPCGFRPERFSDRWQADLRRVSEIDRVLIFDIFPQVGKSCRRTRSTAGVPIGRDSGAIISGQNVFFVFSDRQDVIFALSDGVHRPTGPASRRSSSRESFPISPVSRCGPGNRHFASLLSPTLCSRAAQTALLTMVWKCSSLCNAANGNSGETEDSL